MSKKPTGSIIYWIRSDLRLNDNIALWEAAKSNKDLIVIYIKDLITGPLQIKSAADIWTNKSLLELSARYKKLFNLRLNVYNQDYNTVLKSLYKETKFSHLYINNTYDPEIDAIDNSINKEFGSLFKINAYNSSLLFNPNEILNNAGSFFKVYTPFWKNALNKLNLREPLPFPNIKYVYQKEILSLKNIAISYVDEKWGKKILSYFNPGEVSAREMLGKTSTNIKGYSEGRDFPIKNNTSLSYHLT